MGILGSLKKIINIATLGQVSFLETQIEIGGKTVKASIDLENQVLRFGEEVFREAPGELFFPTLGPLAGVLKNEVEDEVIVFGLLLGSPLGPRLGIVPSITIWFEGVLVVGDLTGTIQHRGMRQDEREVARHVFQGSLPPFDSIVLTDLAGFGGRPFVVPGHAGGVLVNLGKEYVHDGHIKDMPVLMHELTHAWQVRQALLPEVFVCNGRVVQLQNELGEPVYDYTSGDQWSDYGMEQQGAMVQDWSGNLARSTPPPPFMLGSPLFRYVNGNLRRADNDARTADGGSIRARLREAHATSTSLREINPPRPAPWW